MVVAQTALRDRDAWLGIVLLLAQLAAAAKAIGDARRAAGYADLARLEADRAQSELYNLRQDLNVQNPSPAVDSLAPDLGLGGHLDKGHQHESDWERDNGFDR